MNTTKCKCGHDEWILEGTYNDIRYERLVSTMVIICCNECGHTLEIDIGNFPYIKLIEKI